MKKHYFTMLALMLCMSVSAQENGDLKNQIIQKEKALTEATTLSRQGVADLKNELKHLYSSYKSELEVRLNSKLDAATKVATEKELATLIEKMNN